MSVILGFKYPDLDVARWKQLMGAGSDDGSTAGLTREEQIKKLQDADKAKGEKDRVIFGAALVADYLPVAWTGKLCEAFHLSVADLDARTRRPAPSSQPVGLPEGFSLPTEFSHKRPMNADKNDAKKQKTDDTKDDGPTREPPIKPVEQSDRELVAASLNNPLVLSYDPNRAARDASRRENLVSRRSRFGSEDVLRERVRGGDGDERERGSRVLHRG